MLTMYRKCNKCGKRYSWNPSVGKTRCPYCTGNAVVELFQKIAKK